MVREAGFSGRSSLLPSSKLARSIRWLKLGMCGRRRRRSAMWLWKGCWAASLLGGGLWRGSGLGVPCSVDREPAAA